MRYPFKITTATLDVLAVLVDGHDEADDLYGLKIANFVGRATGSVAPILMRLEGCGWVLSRWEDSGPESRGPRRRFYFLHPDHVEDTRQLLSDKGRQVTKPRHSSSRIDAPREV